MQQHLLLLLFVLLFDLSRGCTEITLRTNDGTTVVANALEDPDRDTELRVSVVPRGTTFNSTGCLSFKTTLGFVHGMNEHGLAINEHALDLAVFQNREKGVPTLCRDDFQGWVLVGSCPPDGYSFVASAAVIFTHRVPNDDDMNLFGT